MEQLPAGGREERQGGPKRSSENTALIPFAAIPNPARRGRADGAAEQDASAGGNEDDAATTEASCFPCFPPMVSETSAPVWAADG